MDHQANAAKALSHHTLLGSVPASVFRAMLLTDVRQLRRDRDSCQACIPRLTMHG